ncbi:BTAD domain-containing putative transcriptional regulator [Dactylosporangium darangshiense]|uniref:BTAD domain-containing putative transcriptional regulator n=2 Tax=Dactylosporangium darangshiense TaxID=579108 RepID=A0ABP8CX62_9ACTN
MQFGVLGPVTVWNDDGRPVAVPGLKVRALLAALLLEAGRPVTADRLIEDLWGDRPPGNAPAALSAKVSQLRRVLDDAEPGARRLVLSPPPGYVLCVDGGALDVHRFAELTTAARATPAPAERAALLADALALWRGPAFADFRDEDFTRPVTARLDEQRLVAWEDLAEARLAVGEHDVVAGELAELVAEHPLRERPRALHMLALYRAGRQAEALDGYSRLRVQLQDELGLEPGVEIAALHQAILRQDPALSLPAGPGRAGRNRPATNLPAAVTGLIGRDAAVDALRALVGEHRLVSLTGSGGVGKTRLAIEVARRLEPDCPDGVWLAELAAHGPTDPPELLAGTVLDMLDVHDSAGPGAPQGPVERLVTVLRDRQLLLVLDNCEHLADQVAGLAGRLLGAAPGVRLLATSREPLGLPGETVWPVPPLDVPASADPEAVAQTGAGQLFVARAAAAAHGFALTPGNAAGVALLCRRLDGIPLALELAATRVRALGVEGLVAGLDDRFRLLATGHRGAPPRQQTLLAMIDWSWQLLTGPEQLVLRRLAVHADGCTREAAVVVCADGELSGAAVLDVIGRLVDRSLVAVAEGVDGGGPRYRLLESVAAFGAERLAEAGEAEPIARRAWRYYTELAEAAAPQLYGPGQREWLRRLDAEAANLRTALDRAGDDLPLRLANALAWYWFLRGRLTEAQRALRAALAGAGATRPALRATASAWLTGIVFLLGDIADWPARHAAAVRGLDEVDDPGARARALWFLAFAETDLGDVPAVSALVEQALAQFQEIGDRWGVAAALSLRAKHAHITGDLDALAGDAGRSVVLFRRLGDRWGLLHASEWLAAHAELTGDHRRAADLHQDGLRIAEDLGLWPEVAGRLSWLGWGALQRGDYAAARELSARALRLSQEQGSPLNAIFAEMGLAFAARRAGDLEAADAHLHSLLAAAADRDGEAGQPLHVPSVLVEWGYLAEQRGDAITARRSHAESYAIAQRLGAARDAVHALAGLAGVEALDGGRPGAGRAARILGAVAAARDRLGMPVSVAERYDLDRTAAAARSVLGDADYHAMVTQGRELSAEDAFSSLSSRPSRQSG